MSRQIVPSPEDTARVAASLNRFGWQVFPVQIDGAGKTPLVNAWPERAADADQAVVFEWWEKYPDAWIGLACGGSGLVAVDLDRKHGKDGFAALKAEGIVLPPTLHYTTAGGIGQHHLYRAPAGTWTIGQDVRGPSGRPMPGVDVRAGNGFVVYRGPALTERPDLIEAPEFALLPGGGSTMRHDVTVQQWREAVHPGPMSPEVATILAQVKPMDVGHSAMLDITLALVRLGIDGARGVTDALDQGRMRYVTGYDARKYGKAWDDAVAGAVRREGMPGAHDFVVESDRAMTTLPPEWSADQVSPGDAFDQVGVGQPRLNPEKLRAVVNPHGDLALGTDQMLWRFSGGRYVQDNEVVTRRTVQALRAQYRREAAPLARDMVQYAAGFPRLSDSPPDPTLVNVLNGMLDWRSGDLLPHSTKYRSTVQLPVVFDPAAECPRFDAWLNQVLDPEIVAVAWEVIAYAVMSGNPLQKAAMLLGKPHSGKGTLLRVLERMLGGENIAHVTVKDMADKFAPATLYGKLANIVGDAEGEYVADTAAFKRVVAGDRVQAQNKNAPLFHFTPWAFHIFATNEMARTGDATGGWLRRWVILPFKGTVEIDPEFREADLYAEIPGILAKAVRLLPGLLDRKRFTTTAAMEAHVQDLALLSDPVLLWIAEDDQVQQVDGVRENRTLMHSRYVQWSGVNGHTKPLSSTALYRRLKALGYAEWRTNGGARGFIGLRILPPPTIDAIVQDMERQFMA